MGQTATESFSCGSPEVAILGMIQMVTTKLKAASMAANCAQQLLNFAAGGEELEIDNADRKSRYSTRNWRRSSGMTLSYASINCTI